MEWFIAVVAVAALGVAAMAAAGGVGEMSPQPVRDTFVPQLPERPLSAQDLRDLRFGVTLRGYSMAQVDEVLDRLATELAERDARLAQLMPAPEVVPGPTGPGALGGGDAWAGPDRTADGWASSGGVVEERPAVAALAGRAEPAERTERR